MTHLRIEQGNNFADTEIVSTFIISKLYEFAQEELDENSNLKGRLSVPVTHRKYIEFFAAKYPDLIIVADDYYIAFADSEVGKLCAENWGDGVGITPSQAAVVTSIGDVFKGNTTITSFDELSYFTSLKQFNWSYSDNAFTGCTNLTSIDLRNIKENTEGRNFTGSFANCTNLTTVKNFNGSAIARNMFSGCINLQELNLSNVTGIHESGLRNCASLNVTENGIDFTKVLWAGQNAFIGVLGVGDVQLPNYSGSLHQVFAECPSITSISNCPGVTNFGYQNNVWQASLRNCNALDTLDFSLSTQTTTVYRGMVSNCSALRIIKLPSSITSIAGRCIENCQNMQALVINATEPPELVTGAGGATFLWSELSIPKIYVPDDSVASYKSATGWTSKANDIYSLSQYAIDFPND